MNHVSGTRTGDMEAVYRADLAMGAHSARHLRRILRLYLTRWGLLDVADAAELALTELIANVVRHVPGRRCQALIYLLPDGGVRVEVADGSPRLPRAVAGDLLDEGGRGLLLVDAVTDKWGVEERRDGCGKTVWFECAQREAEAASSASTASVNGVQTSAAHGPKARSVSATQAAPATGSIQRNVPDWPK
jgi:anti-sigma regulatory factor (Ser/Thr protein kinase)